MHACFVHNMHNDVSQMLATHAKMLLEAACLPRDCAQMWVWTHTSHDSTFARFWLATHILHKHHTLTHTHTHAHTHPQQAVHVRVSTCRDATHAYLMPFSCMNARAYLHARCISTRVHAQCIQELCVCVCGELETQVPRLCGRTCQCPRA